MSVLFNAQSSTTWDGVSSVTFAHTTAGTNRALIVSAAWYDGSASLITGVTYAGVAMTKVTGRISEYNLGVEMWKLSNPTLGNNNVVITFDDAAGAGAAGAASFTGAFQTTSGLLGTADSTVANASSINLRLASSADEMVVDVFGSNVTATVGAGQVQLWNRSDPYANICAASYETGTNSVVMSWSLTTDAYAGIAAAIKSAAGVENTITATSGQALSLIGQLPSTFKVADAKPPRGLLIIHSDEQHVDPVYVDPSTGRIAIVGAQQGTDVAAPGYTPETGLFTIRGNTQDVGLTRSVTPTNGVFSTRGYAAYQLIGGNDTYPPCGAIALFCDGEVWAETTPWLRDRDRDTGAWTAAGETSSTWTTQADSTGFWTEVPSLKDV